MKLDVLGRRRGGDRQREARRVERPHQLAGAVHDRKALADVGAEERLLAGVEARRVARAAGPEGGDRLAAGAAEGAAERFLRERQAFLGSEALPAAPVGDIGVDQHSVDVEEHGAHGGRSLAAVRWRRVLGEGRCC